MVGGLTPYITPITHVPKDSNIGVNTMQKEFKSGIVLMMRQKDITTN